MLLALAALAPQVAIAQIDAQESTADEVERLGPATAVRHRTGVKITASRGAVRDIRAMVAVPLACPEQSVRVISEDYSPEVEVAEFRDVEGGEARQLFIRIPYLEGGKTAQALVTYEVVTHTILPPPDQITAELRVPRRLRRDVKRHTGPSPFINVGHRKIRAAVKEALKDLEEEHSEPTPWQRIEAFYDYALEHVEYEEGDDKSSIAALTDGIGDCQAVSAVFVAMCRTAKIPARMVWVQEHQYAEFYLENEQGDGIWHPIESAGTRAFGAMPLARTILQKGDNFKVPERPRERLRYATDHLKGFPTPGGGKPKVRYIREEI